MFARSQELQAEFIDIFEEEMITWKLPLTCLNRIKSEADKMSDKRIVQGEHGNGLFIGLNFLSTVPGGFILTVAKYIYA